MDTFPVAILAFDASADPAANAASIGAAIDQAAAAGARLLLTPEAALCGYPGAARAGLDDLSSCDLAEREDLLHLRAERAGIALVLGTAASHPAGGWSNEAFCCGAVPQVQRYRKRSLTPLDARHFRPGESAVVLELDGWRFGLSICYEARFPAWWGGQALAGVDCFLTIAHMAGPDPDPGTKASVVPAHYTSRAAEWVTPLVLCNTAAADRWVDSGCWDARGMRIAQCAEGLVQVAVPHRDRLDPWYLALREEALQVQRRADRHG